jgi:hypothetical protein
LMIFLRNSRHGSVEIFSCGFGLFEKGSHCCDRREDAQVRTAACSFGGLKCVQLALIKRRAL